MRSQPDSLTSLDSKEPASTAALTQRLYQNSSEGSSFESGLTPMEELKRLAGCYQVDLPKSSEGIEPLIKAFQKKHAEHLTDYLNNFSSRPVINSHSLYLLNGWNQENNSILADHFRKSTGGYYLRWNGIGIVINPGRNFLEKFHQQGLHIRDIDAVIVTGSHNDCYADVEAIYALNYKLNKISPQLHLINYYLSPSSAHALTAYLKPNFKQERNTVHNLELYQDSSSESIELTQGVSFSYFLLDNHNLGLRFDLNNGSEIIRLGYFAGGPWSSTLASQLEGCKVILARFGSTNPDSLGYLGTHALMEAVKPKLLLVGEFNPNEGDIRLEVIKMLRQHQDEASTVVLPVDGQLQLDLKSMEVQCSITKKGIELSQVCVVKSAPSFGTLSYLSPLCFG